MSNVEGVQVAVRLVTNSSYGRAGETVYVDENVSKKLIKHSYATKADNGKDTKKVKSESVKKSDTEGEAV